MLERHARSHSDEGADVNETVQAIYFGCWHGAGHYIYLPNGTRFYSVPLGFPWTLGLLDTGLLMNGKHEDVCDGKVFWTGGGNPLWLAFYWWDRSGDKRGNSNSGFYVRGFNFSEREAALEYAKEQFPQVVSRQAHPLVLQDDAGRGRR